MTAHVVSVHRSADHTFSKASVAEIELVAGIGVVGDAHAGARVKHRSRVKRDPTQPNLRQVHLIHAELFDEVSAAGHEVSPGDLGENVTTKEIDLLGLPVGSVLQLGADTLVAVTGLRNPCGQIEGFQEGLLAQVRPRNRDGEIVLKGGVMAVVLNGGIVRPGDSIEVAAPPGPHRPLERV